MFYQSATDISSPSLVFLTLQSCFYDYGCCLGSAKFIISFCLHVYWRASYLQVYCVICTWTLVGFLIEQLCLRLLVVHLPSFSAASVVPSIMEETYIKAENSVARFYSGTLPLPCQRGLLLDVWNSIQAYEYLILLTNKMPIAPLQQQFYHSSNEKAKLISRAWNFRLFKVAKSAAC